jgi:hypothetical protein
MRNRSLPGALQSQARFWKQDRFVMNSRISSILKPDLSMDQAFCLRRNLFPDSVSVGMRLGRYLG